ncbi:MAG: hypothetical protein HIU88_05620 [Acidobacteria bacterium]|nr:hypothetical protein [Acidobacteriota bacterium]
METEGVPAPGGGAELSPADAAELLRRHEELRDRAASQGPSRSFALLTLATAVMVSSYMAVYLLTLRYRPGGASTLTLVLVIPALIFSPLLSGARERFAVRRRRPGPLYWAGNGLLLAAFIVLGGLSIAGVGYPWWLALALPGAAFVTLASRPVRRLLSETTPKSERWQNHPLTGSARRVTVAIGVMTGLIAATSTWRWFSIVFMAAMLLLLAMGWMPRWGLPRTGYEWGPIHWASFAVVTTAMFLLVILFSVTAWDTTPVSVGAGAGVFVVMLAVAFLPARAQHGSSD